MELEFSSAPMRRSNRSAGTSPPWPTSLTFRCRRIRGPGSVARLLGRAAQGLDRGVRPAEDSFVEYWQKPRNWPTTRACVDIEYNFPFGIQELEGIAAFGLRSLATPEAQRKLGGSSTNRSSSPPTNWTTPPNRIRRQGLSPSGVHAARARTSACLRLQTLHGQVRAASSNPRPWIA